MRPSRSYSPQLALSLIHISKLKEVYKMADIDHLLDVDDLVFDNTETIHSDR